MIQISGYPINTPKILWAQGYTDDDFSTTAEDGGTVRLNWFAASGPPAAAEVAAAAPLIENRQRWAAQAAARKEREARAALAEPDSDDPAVLRRKLNAALQLLNVR